MMRHISSQAIIQVRFFEMNLRKALDKIVQAFMHHASYLAGRQAIVLGRCLYEDALA